MQASDSLPFDQQHHLPAERDAMADPVFEAMLNSGFLSLPSLPFTLDGADHSAFAADCPQPPGAAVQGLGVEHRPSLWESGSSDTKVAAFSLPTGSTLMHPASSRPAESPHTSSGGGVPRGSHRSAEEKAQAVQEKNRRAQKRFRDRQKEKMKTMEDQVKSLTKQVEQLRTSTNNMTSRNSILEKVLSLREEQLQTYQKDLKVFGTPADAPLQLLNPQKQSADGAAVCTDDPANKDQLVVKSRSANEVLAQWKGYVKELAVLLAEIEHADASTREELGNRVLRVISAAGQLCMYTALFTPLTSKKLCASLGDERQLMTMGNAVERWQPIVSSLELSGEQMDEVSKLLAIFTQREMQLLEERRQLTAAMQAATHADFSRGEMRPPVRDLVKLYDLSAALTGNLRDEHNTAVDFLGTLYKKVFTPMQLARIMVHSYPVYPDAMALATCIARGRTRQAAQVGNLLTAA